MEGDFWCKRHVLVTGANGFVGSNIIAELINRGAKVFALVNRDVDKNPVFESVREKIEKVIVGDIAEYELIFQTMAKHDIDTIFHLAAQAIVGDAFGSPIDTFRTNIFGTINILEASRNCPRVRGLVIASTTHVYGDNKNLPYLESFFPQPSRPYETSKACADLLAKTYYYTYNLPVVIARCTNTYGPGDFNFSRLIPKVMRSVALGEDIEIIGGTSIRDYIYVKDVVRAYLILAENIEKEGVRGEAYNFGSGSLFSALEMAKLVIKVINKDDVRVMVHKPKNEYREIDKQYVSTEKALKMLNWTPQYGVEKGLGETYEWYREVFSMHH